MIFQPSTASSVTTMLLWSLPLPPRSRNSQKEIKQPARKFFLAMRYIHFEPGARPAPLPPSVLVYSTELQDSLLYVLESETADDTQIGLRDAVTGVRLTLKLPAQRAAIALIGKHERTVLAKYGF